MTSPSASRPALLGIDLGTSSVKAVVTELGGELLAHASASYPVVHDHPGWAETDPLRWLSATIVAVRQVLDSVRVDIRAVGLSGQMHGLVPADVLGKPVRSAMLWSDSRAVGRLGAYHQLPSQLGVRLANPLTPGMAGPMLAWLRDNEPETYRRSRWALRPKDWLCAQLTGQIWSEPSDASATLLYDVAADRWDSDIVGALKLDSRLLPELLASAGSCAGQLTAVGADLLNLPTGVPVAAGAADTAAAALGSGLTVGTAQLTIGSGAQVVTPYASLPSRPHGQPPVTHLYRAATSRGWYGMGAVANAGLDLDRVRSVPGASWAELYAAASLPPHKDDPYFLPHLQGERTPYLDPDMRGAWVRLSPRHDRSRLLRAALEGVAFSIADAVHALLAESPVDHLRLAGGGSTHPVWRQLLADVLALPLRAVNVSAASGRGAALLGAQAAGLMTEHEVLARLISTTELVASPAIRACRLLRATQQQLPRDRPRAAAGRSLIASRTHRTPRRHHEREHVIP